MLQLPCYMRRWCCKKNLTAAPKKGWANGSTAVEKPCVAALAQLVEHLIRNEGVGGSNPSSGTIFQMKS